MNGDVIFQPSSPFIPHIPPILYLDLIAPCLTLVEQTTFARTHKWAKWSTEKANIKKKLRRHNDISFVPFQYDNQTIHAKGDQQSDQTSESLAFSTASQSPPFSSSSTSTVASTLLRSIHQAYDRMLLRRCVRALLAIPPPIVLLPSSYITHDSTSDFYNYLFGFFSVELRLAEVEWPPHAAIGFWRRGPGDRNSYMRIIQQNVRYFVFEPNQMNMASGIWHPRVLAEAMEPKVSCNSYDRTTGELASMWMQRRADVRATLVKMVETDWIDPDAACCGVGEATDIPGTAAVQELSTHEEHLECAAGTKSLTQTLPILHKHTMEWSRSERRHFLIAWERMLAVKRAVFNSGGHALPLHHIPNHPPPELSETCRVPIPFILPWPIAGSDGDKERTDAIAAGQAPPRWNSDENGRLKDEDWRKPFRVWLPDNRPHSSQSAYAYEQPEWTNSSDSVGPLSSIVRGCPWPVDRNPDTDSTRSRHHAEQRLVAYHVVRALHVSKKCAQSIFIYANSYWPGKRPLQKGGDPQPQTGAVEPEAAEIFPVPASDDAECPFPLSTIFCNRWCVNDAHMLSSSLESSFLFSFGVDQLSPWPLVMVAPLAPGWIGGLIMGENSFNNF